jgi:hypothetical protein
MPALTNSRHEQFAAFVAGGMTATRAYSAAGFTGKGAAQSASRLAKRPSVAARIAELRNISSTVIVHAVIDREFVLTGLKDIASDTKLKETARVRAYELLGKELGMFRDAVDITQKLDADPKKWTTEQLQRVTKELEEQVGPEIAAAEREAARREMDGTETVQ